MKKFFKFLFKLLGKLVVIALVFFVVTFGLYMTATEGSSEYHQFKKETPFQRERCLFSY